ncbi:MAG: A24 family peptidase [Candidatus Hodarchaeota archaeon]
MDNLLSLIIIFWVFILLLYAAIRDWKTREVTNWVWVVALFILPLTLIRVYFSGLFVFYGVEIFANFILVILGFRFGVLGGADGKAILLISLTHPWITLESTWMLFASIGVLIGGFLIVGIHSIILLILNVVRWRRRPSCQDEKPPKRIFWLTRRLIQSPAEGSKTVWAIENVPLVVYILVAYTVMLGLMATSLVVFV